MVWKAYTCLNIWFNLTFNAPFWSLINGSKITNLCECLAKSAVISKLLRTRFRPIYRLFPYIVGLYIVMTLSIPRIQSIADLLGSNLKNEPQTASFLNLRLDRCNSQVKNIKNRCYRRLLNLAACNFTANWNCFKAHICSELIEYHWNFIGVFSIFCNNLLS